MSGVAEAAVERQQRDEADHPEGDADLHGPDTVHVERLDVGDQVGAVADLVDDRLVVAQLHGVTLGAPGPSRPTTPPGHPAYICRTSSRGVGGVAYCGP
jgi:hypothetical protein